MKPQLASLPDVSSESSLYLSALRNHAERVLSLLDRDTYSPTFGCMDRTFWAWKFTDFPGARFQEGLCYLSFLFATEFPGNPYFNSAKLVQWIAGGFDFWASIQRSGGDFDEVYPFERSLAATAFSSFYLSEAWTFLGGRLPDDTDARFRATLARAADWLARNDESHGFLSNHLAAAAAALTHAHRITGHARFQERSQYFLTKILSHQSPERWYEEYGGADPGYQTHGSFYLARIHQLTGSPELLRSLDHACTFLAHFIHPDRSIGGEYTSRNTQTYYPAAFEMLAAQSPAAAWIAREMRPAITTRSAAGVDTVDIYNLFPLLNNSVFAHIGMSRSQRTSPESLPTVLESGICHFPHAGLLKVSRPRYDLFVGLYKGGVFKLFDRSNRRLVRANSGYVGRLHNGNAFSSQWSDPKRSIRLLHDEVHLEGAFYQISRPVMDPWRFLGFRLFSLTAGRYPRAAAWLKRLLVRVLIYRKREIPLAFRRVIRLRDDGIEVRDHLQGSNDSIRDITALDAFTTVHMGSSKYFVPHELGDLTDDPFGKPIEPAQLPTGVDRTVHVCLEPESN